MHEGPGRLAGLRLIDLRSDICSQPTAEMREAMHASTLGWATYGEDASVRELERLAAALLGHEACVLVPTSTMGNLVAMLVLAQEGGKVVVEREAHVLRQEGGGITQLARMNPVEVSAVDGRLDTADLEPVIAGAAMLWIENTHTHAGGRVVTAEQTERLVRLAHAHGARVHIDGARLPNAAVALGVPLAALAGPADTVVISLNKGLSAPYGALLAGSSEVIALARDRLRQLGGGTVHKAGYGAAAGILALRTMLPQLEEDHRRARELASLLELHPDDVETNIVFLPVPDAATLLERLRAHGVLAMARDERRVRFVTHRLIDDADIETAAAAIHTTLAAVA
jgi:threonine aldolase